METMEFDAALGGTEELPNSANSLKFAASRSVEIAAMTESILRPSKTKLIFQSLPVHMRRRVMSHNCKRLPKRLREGHMEQLKKSGLPPKQKRPSRKYRRRPTQLRQEYHRRYTRFQNVWLETHTWHAKRFHMIKRWNNCLPYRPCDKAFRACYRATSAHCLIQDISYHIPIHIEGSLDNIKDLFSCITGNNCGLSVGAKAFVNGKREGSINLFMPYSYPFGYIGNISFLWVPSEDVRKELWLFVHPSLIKNVGDVLSSFTSKSEIEKIDSENTENSKEDINTEYCFDAKRRKILNVYSDIKIKIMPGTFQKFRLTGPKSHAVMINSLKYVESVEKIQSNEWVQYVLNEKKVELALKEKCKYWSQLSSLHSPSQLPPRMVIGLTVKDPRWSRPHKRTKAEIKSYSTTEIETLTNIPPYLSTSPLWETTVRSIILANQISNPKFIEHITKTQLVPGEVNEDDPKLQSIPIILIQQPGSQDARFKKIGYGSGWDIIIPLGYALPFWLTFIMFGARAGGVRETENLAFELGKCYFPPDSEAGKLEEIRIESELKEKYFKKPPSKRVNFIKLAVPSPFICPWNILLRNWSPTLVEDFFVLRDKTMLDTLQDCMQKKIKVPKMKHSDVCLVPVYIQIIGKGNLAKNATICLPQTTDITSGDEIVEPYHKDYNTQLRKEKRREHKKLLKQLRKRRIRLRKKETVQKARPKLDKKEPSEYVKMMRDMWLPSKIESARFTGIREVMGYLPQATYSFSEAKSCGVGYVAANALIRLLDLKLNKVLVRNTTSRVYRLANIQIIKSH